MKIVYIFLIFISYGSFARNLGLTPIDFEYESRLYNIYENFHSRRLTFTQWNSIISQRSVDVYTVQKKDTLWDISKVLFGDAYYWPKLWSLNAYITNPHQIDVGYKLMVVGGTESEAPQAVLTSDGGSLLEDGVSSSSPSSSPTSTTSTTSSSPCSQNLDIILNRQGKLTQVYSQEIQCSDIQTKLKERRESDSVYVAENLEVNIPGQSKQRLGSFPRSLPPVDLYLHSDVDLSGLRRERYPNVNLVEHYLTERSDIHSIGKVRDFDFVPIKGSEIVIELNVPANIGSQYTIIRPLERLPSRSLFARVPFGGYEVSISGTVRITAPIPGESGYFFAEIEEMFAPIYLNYDVIERNPHYFDFEAPVRWGNNSAQIIGTPKNQSHFSLTFHSFIYLNRGQSDGINQGDTLEIWAHPRFHKKVPKKPLGSVLVVHTSDRFSTGFVNDLKSPAYVGDYVRSRGGDGFISEENEDVYDVEEFESPEEEELFFEENEEEIDIPQEEVEEFDFDTEDSSQEEFDFDTEDSSQEEFDFDTEDSSQEEFDFDTEDSSQEEFDFDTEDSSQEEFNFENEDNLQEEGSGEEFSGEETELLEEEEDLL